MRNSSVVVAPIQRISPLDRQGLSRLARSGPSPEAPAPLMRWNSSKKRITLGSEASFKSVFIRASKSPRNRVPARSEEMSISKMRRSRIASFASEATTLCANPYTIELLPVPASPSNRTLPFRFRRSDWARLSISSSLPMMIGSLPHLARCVRSRPRLRSAGNRCMSGLGISSSSGSPERANANFSTSKPSPFITRIGMPSPSTKIASNRCRGSTRSFASFREMRSAIFKTALHLGVGTTSSPGSDELVEEMVALTRFRQ